MTKPLIIGIGNRLRGDDSVGLRAAESMRELAEVQTCEANALDLIDLWEGSEHVFLIDAVSTGEKEIGFVHRYVVGKEKIPALFSRASTHLFDVAQVLELAETLGKLPSHVVLYGIEAEVYKLGAEPSGAMDTALKQAIQDIKTDIRKQLIGE